jgi:N-formylglutamate deformylase
MSPFHLTGRLDGASPILLASPHSGTYLPADFRAGTRLPLAALRRIEDAHVGRLLAPAAAHAPLIEATHSRAVIDLNRAEDELDPAMFGAPPMPAPRLTERVRRGYGLFPRLAGPNQPIHAGPIAPALAEARIAALHRPWHAAIAAGLAAARLRHGRALLLDIHSMPSLEGANPPRLVLGDLNGSSAAPALVDWLERAFAEAGLSTARNAPYAGGYTTERHGAPSTGIHAVQLEFDRALYMEPGSLRPHAGFAPLTALLASVVERLSDAIPSLDLAPPLPLAAE